MFFFRCFFFLFRFQLTSEVVLTYIGQTHLNKKWLKWWSSVGWLDGYQVGESGGRIQSHLWLGMNKNLSKKSYETLDAPFFCKDFQATGFFLGVLWFSFLCPEFFFSELTYSPENCWSWTSTPVEEENHLPNLHLQVPAIRFSAVSPRKTLQSKAYPRWWTAKTLRQK